MERDTAVSQGFCRSCQYQLAAGRYPINIASSLQVIALEQMIESFILQWYSTLLEKEPVLHRMGFLFAIITCLTLLMEVHSKSAWASRKLGTKQGNIVCANTLFTHSFESWGCSYMVKRQKQKQQQVKLLSGIRFLQVGNRDSQP